MKISTLITKAVSNVPAGLSQFVPYMVGQLVGKKSVYVIRNPQTKLFEGIVYRDGKVISVGIPQQNAVKFI